MQAVSISRPVRDVRLATIGQSIIDQVNYTSGATGLATQLIATAVSPTVGAVEFIENGSNGGACSCAENDPVEAAANNYFVNYNNGSPTDGPLLTNAINEITTRVGLGTAPTAYIWDQGTADVTAAAGQTVGVSASQALTNFLGSWSYAFERLQSVLDAPVPIYMMILGRAVSISSIYFGGYEAIRKAQLSLLGSVANTYRAPEYYDMALTGSVHPDRNWQAEYGRRLSRIIANTQYAGTQKLGPIVTGATLVNSMTVEVSISVESGDSIVKPSNPWGFRFNDNAGDLLSPIWSAWNGNNPRWTFATAPGSVKVAYIDDYGATFDPTRVIHSSTSGLPLRSFYS